MWLLSFLACQTPDPTDDAAGKDTADTASPDSGATDSGTDSSSDSGTDSAGDSDSGEETDSGAETATPADADLDGYLSDEDCDDTNAAIHPGATELCDPVDQDCDGATLAPGVCGAPMTLSAVSTLVSATSSASFLGDVLGEGHVAIGAEDGDVPCPDGYTTLGLSVYSGGRLDLLPVDAPVDAKFSLSEVGACNYTPAVAAGDLDGDGTGDLLFIDGGCEYQVSAQLGPLPAEGGDRWYNDTSAFWTSWHPEEGWMAFYDYGKDLDGDGRMDFIGSEVGNADTPDASHFDVFFGGDWGNTAVRVYSESIYSADRLSELDDLDGDGVSDVVVLRQGGTDGSQYMFLSGVDLRGADHALSEDFAFATTPMEPDDTIGLLYENIPWKSVGDWNGDGANDLVVNAFGSESSGASTGEIFLLDGNISGSFSLLDKTLGSWVGTSPDRLLLENVIHPDSTGDASLIASQGSYDVFLIPHRIPDLHEPVSGLELSNGMITHGRPADFDGDGREDWIYGSLDDGNVSMLWLGWDIPWDEAEWW